jgi:hypothetical protein
MTSRTLAVLSAMNGFMSLFWPNYTGFLSANVPPITSGEGRIAAAIYLVGACILWCMPARKD